MEKVKIIDIPFLSEDIIMSSNFDNVYTLSASTVLGLESFIRLNKVTYLANRSAENFKNFEENSDVNLIAFEDL